MTFGMQDFVREAREKIEAVKPDGAGAALASATLDRMGYRARVIERGLEGWCKAGRPVET